MQLTDHVKPFALAGLVLALTLVGPSAAADFASPWADHPNVRVRLVGGFEDKVTQQRWIAVEMRLAPGWKTYWRMPGDAGIPPAFDWAGSENVLAAVVQYPTPIAMPDQGGIAVGYKGAVTLPIAFTSPAPAAASRVALEVAFGVCKDICIPVEAKLQLTVPPSSAGGEAVIAAARRLVPLTDAEAATSPAARTLPRLASASAVLAGPAPKLDIRAAAATDIFVEAPDGIFLPLARKVSDDRFEIDLTKSPDVKDLPGKVLRLTIVGPGGARDTSWTVK